MFKKILQIIWKGWKKFAHFLGVIMSHIILTLFYFIIFGLVAIIKKFVNLFSKSESHSSYWIKKSQIEKTSNYEQQF